MLVLLPKNKLRRQRNKQLLPKLNGTESTTNSMVSFTKITAEPSDWMAKKSRVSTSSSNKSNINTSTMPNTTTNLALESSAPLNPKVLILLTATKKRSRRMKVNFWIKWTVSSMINLAENSIQRMDMKLLLKTRIEKSLTRPRKFYMLKKDSI